MFKDAAQVLNLAMIVIPLLLIAGIYCILVTRNLIRIIIGLEILTKAVTLLLVVAGYATGELALTQALVITLIIIEVVIMVVAAGIIINVSRLNNSLDVRKLDKMKG